MLRGIAPLIVIWCHLVGGMSDGLHASWLPLSVVRAVTQPVGIIQDGGFLGVAMFFVISGFIITHVGLAESARAFVVKRAFRIYAPLAVAIVFIVLFAHAFAAVTGHASYWTGLSGADVVASATLLDHVTPFSHAVDDVTWTLVVEVVFYALCACILPLIRRSPAVGVVAMLAAVAVITAGGPTLGTGYWLLAMNVTMVPYLVIGQVTYLAWSHRLRLAPAAALVIAAYLVLIVRSETFIAHTLWPSNRYDVQFGYAFVAFLVVLRLGPRLRVPRILRATSAMSYSLYLYHAPVGVLVMSEVYPAHGFTAALGAALVAVFAVSWASWRLVEVPAQRAARRLLARWRDARPAVTWGAETGEPQAA